MELAHNCEYKIDSRCMIAEQFARFHGCKVHVIPTSEACNECLNGYKPKQVNNVTVSIAVKECIKQDQMTIGLMEENKKVLSEYEAILPTFTTGRYPNGPGTILHKIFSSLGFEPKNRCSCWHHVHIMNVRGPKWCREHVDEIFNWISRNNSWAKLPLVSSAVKMLIMEAVRQSEKGELADVR
ncbi:MAG: hypothetical protein KatS3mg087_1042 [Patescibacteria group bacterium]|nr:MAG: hypothetical protein KatS3mg087_1042 [Patescibacteria group bacterium]